MFSLSRISFEGSWSGIFIGIAALLEKMDTAHRDDDNRKGGRYQAINLNKPAMSVIYIRSGE